MNVQNIRKGKWGFMTMLIAISFVFSGMGYAEELISEETRLDFVSGPTDVGIKNLKQSSDGDNNVYAVWVDRGEGR